MNNSVSAPLIDWPRRAAEEASRRRALAVHPQWAPSEGPLLIVSPHPDDAVLSAGGLIYSWKRLGREVTILSLTDGEAAYPKWRRLAQVRREELREAVQVLADEPVLIVRLGIPDGRISDFISKVRAAIISLLAPDTTVIAPYERDGRADHDAAGRVCSEVAHTHGFSLARYPIWTGNHTHPTTLDTANWGRYPLVEEAQSAKAAAVLCFFSQLFPYRRTPIIQEPLMDYFARPFEVFFL